MKNKKKPIQDMNIVVEGKGAARRNICRKMVGIGISKVGVFRKLLMFKSPPGREGILVEKPS